MSEFGKYVTMPNGSIQWVEPNPFNPNSPVVPGTYYNNGNEFTIDNSLLTDQGNPTLESTDNTGSWLGKFIGDKDFSPLALSLKGLNLLSNAYFGNKQYQLNKEDLARQKAEGIHNATSSYLNTTGNLLNKLGGLQAFNENAAANAANDMYAVASSAANSLANLGAPSNTYTAPLNQIDKYRTVKA